MNGEPMDATIFANVKKDGDRGLMGADHVYRIVEMDLLFGLRNVTGHLDVMIKGVTVNKTTHTTMRVGCACIVGMGLLRVQRNVTWMMNIVRTEHANAVRGIH